MRLAGPRRSVGLVAFDVGPVVFILICHALFTYFVIMWAVIGGYRTRVVLPLN